MIVLKSIMVMESKERYLNNSLSIFFMKQTIVLSVIPAKLGSFPFV